MSNIFVFYQYFIDWIYYCAWKLDYLHFLLPTVNRESNESNLIECFILKKWNLYTHCDSIRQRTDQNYFQQYLDVQIF